MRARRALLAAVTAWLAVVLVGATVVWAVISRAGEELAASDRQPWDTASAARSADPEVSKPAKPIQRRPGKTRTPAEPSSSAPSSPGQQPSSSPSTGLAPPTAPSSGTPPPPTNVITATWDKTPGTVRISCRGEVLLNNYYVSAHLGWETDGKPELSDGKLEVHFQQENGDGEYELTARCVGGSPQFVGHDDDD